MEMNAVSLFSGAMGLDIGLMQAGIKTVLAQDFDSSCIQTIKANGFKCLEGDIRNLSVQNVLDASGLNAGDAFLVCGGPPCQPFSTAGPMKGLNDPRGSLFKDFSRMVEGLKPRFFIMENVRGLASLPIAPQSDTTALDIVLMELGRLGYATVHGILNAVDYGVPQFRERLIVVGSRDSEPIFLPKPTHFQKHQSRMCRWQTLWDAIGDLECIDGEGKEFSASKTETMRLVPEGGNWKDLPPDVQAKAMKGTLYSEGGRTGCFRRLSYSEPCPTLTTSPDQKTTTKCHPKFDRPLNVREYARVQQFPDNWTFNGKTADKYRQIGNAVPVGLGRALGEMLASVADGTAEVKCKKTSRMKQMEMKRSVMDFC